MAIKQMEAKYAGTCADTACTDKDIKPGDRINYGGKGAVTHEGCTAIEAPARPKGSGRRSGYGRSRRGFAAPRGRCEDAPCCGCCPPYGGWA